MQQQGAQLEAEERYAIAKYLSRENADARDEWIAEQACRSRKFLAVQTGPEDSWGMGECATGDHLSPVRKYRRLICITSTSNGRWHFRASRRCARNLCCGPTVLFLSVQQMANVVCVGPGHWLYSLAICSRQFNSVFIESRHDRRWQSDIVFLPMISARSMRSRPMMAACAGRNHCAGSRCR